MKTTSIHFRLLLVAALLLITAALVLGASVMNGTPDTDIQKLEQTINQGQQSQSQDDCGSSFMDPNAVSCN